MENTDWLKQTDKPLFPDMLWSRPENKAQSGKLLIVGGSSHGFTAPAGAFAAAEQAGIGSVRVFLPDSLQKTLGKSFSEAEFAPSTPSGSFSRQALAALVENANWADGVLLAGDFGRNSETAIFLEAFLEKYIGELTLCGDSLDYFLNDSSPVLERQHALLVMEFGKLQALAMKNRPIPPLKHSMDLYALVKALAGWSEDTPVSFCSIYAGRAVVASAGKVSTTPVKSVDLTALAAYLSVWWLQNPTKPFEAFTTAAYSYRLARS